MSEKTPKRGIDIEKMEAELSAKGISWFLGIGINLYQYDFPNLNNAKKDVEDILSILKERYQIDRELLLFDDEATRDNIVDQLQILDDKSKDGDKIIIYYAGHGYLDDKERGYWIPHDAEINRVASYIRNSTIREILSGFAAKHTLIISDSCFSGSLLTRDIGNMQAAFEDLERDRSRWVFSSGRQSEPVADGKAGENSPFAANIIRELDRNTAPYLNAGLLFDKVMKLTRFNYQQLPQSGPLYGSGHEGGQYIFHLKVSADSAWNDARRLNTLKSYSDYLANFPKGDHAKDALQAITRLEDQKEWENAKGIDKIYAYAKYLQSFPNPVYAVEAKARMEELEKGSESKSKSKVPKSEKKSIVASETAPTSITEKSKRNLIGSTTGLIFTTIILGICWTLGLLVVGDEISGVRLRTDFVSGAFVVILPTLIFLNIQYRKLKIMDTVWAILFGIAVFYIITFVISSFFTLGGDHWSTNEAMPLFSLIFAAVPFFMVYRIQKAYSPVKLPYLLVGLGWGLIWLIILFMMCIPRYAHIGPAFIINTLGTFLFLILLRIQFKAVFE